jgi:uncharacterized protein
VKIDLPASRITIGVISDTHIPDRVRTLDPQVLTIFKEAHVSVILHAGDVSIPGVLQQLAEIAPVTAVRGNRDWVALRHLPHAVQVSLGGVQIGLTHGHGRPWNYIRDRVDYMIGGYRLEMFQPRLLETFPQARVIVFGHTHRPLNEWVDGTLLFNPGSPHFSDRKDVPLSVGLLHISVGGEVEGELRALNNRLEDQ